eukprot:5036611-Prymnesium_polylepis.1
MRRRDAHAFGARIALASGQLFFGRSRRRGGAVSRRMSQDARPDRESAGTRSEWVAVVWSGAPMSPRKAAYGR